MYQTKGTYIASKVLLTAQDGIIPIELTFQLSDRLLDTLLVRRQPNELLGRPFKKNGARDRIKLSILDARGLLELCAGLGICGISSGPDPERSKVTTDCTRFVQLETIVLLSKG